MMGGAAGKATPEDDGRKNTAFSIKGTGGRAVPRHLLARYRHILSTDMLIFFARKSHSCRLMARKQSLPRMMKQRKSFAARDWEKMRFGLAIYTELPVEKGVVPYFERIGMIPEQIVASGAAYPSGGDERVTYLFKNTRMGCFEFIGSRRSDVGYGDFLRYGGTAERSRKRIRRMQRTARPLHERVETVDAMLAYLKRCGCTVTAAVMSLRSNEHPAGLDRAVIVLPAGLDREAAGRFLEAAEAEILPRILLS